MEVTWIKIPYMVLGSILTGVRTILVLMYNLWFLQSFKIWTWYRRMQRGMKVKHIKQNSYSFCYFTQGKPGAQPSILMLHGFLFNKDMWLDTLENIPEDIHVVCVDLPGHGATTRLLGDSYAAADQAERIHEFVECIGLDKNPFHLVGFSMGGLVAGVYAALYPSHVCCLSLLSPGGLRYQGGYEFVRHFWELNKSMSVESNHLLSSLKRPSEELLKLGLYHPSLFQLQLLKGYLLEGSLQKSFFMKIFFDLSIRESRYSLQDNASKIKAPTEIIWGKCDKIFDPSGADILAKAIPHCQVNMLDRCGHFITMDRPQKSAELILEFHNSVCGAKKTN
ncbi:monoacylglycerol lipase ABHD6-like [Sphaerodactylus townsendi]|uniref:monoacylglycerol lipase ABHD6-like n=1 Tax=Sphaerodactylus townsendi TaxID=933632 RepID=UPI0020261036|nr:monoacylglycerol lipase ABHD6-like [Sphaerodactylus townsendi]